MIVIYPNDKLLNNYNIDENIRNYQYDNWLNWQIA